MWWVRRDRRRASFEGGRKCNLFVVLSTSWQLAVNRMAQNYDGEDKGMIDKCLNLKTFRQQTSHLLAAVFR